MSQDRFEFGSRSNDYRRVLPFGGYVTVKIEVQWFDEGTSSRSPPIFTYYGRSFGSPISNPRERQIATNNAIENATAKADRDKQIRDGKLDPQPYETGKALEGVRIKLVDRWIRYEAPSDTSLRRENWSDGQRRFVWRDEKGRFKKVIIEKNAQRTDDDIEDDSDPLSEFR